MNSKIFFLCVGCLIFFGCSDKADDDARNTFYVDYKCPNDTLLNILRNATSGKVSYFDKERNLQIVSLNYVTESHPKTHFFKIIEELPKHPEDNIIKYEISFNGSMINDSIAYAVKKYIYQKKSWKPKSEMGTIKVFSLPSEFDKPLRVIKKNVARNVVEVIARDSYDK